MSALRESTSRKIEFADFIQLGDILEIRRARLPSDRVRLFGDSLEIRGPNGSERRVTLAPERRGPNDCRIVTPSGIQPFHFSGAGRWADFDEIREALGREAREASGFSRDVVFAPLKIVITDQGRNQPVRAVLTHDPVYPQRGRLARLLPGQTLWMTYAALGLLNSAIGQALYQDLMDQHADQTSSSDDRAIDALTGLPLAPRRYDRVELERVSHLVFQVSTLYEARSEPRRPHLRSWIEAAIKPVRELLLVRLLCLLSLEKSEERRLLRSVEALLDGGDRTVESVIAAPREFPTHDPLWLLDKNYRTRYKFLTGRILNGSASSTERNEYEDLKWLKYWEETALAPLPEIPPEESPSHQSQYPLRGKLITYVDPEEPVALHDWEALQ
ncbi:MAG TPA: hypothetical protein VFJ58_28400 [Armatimonadota bacterium]|nr:hypothetical protein [Armatimonadota bacterium]